MEMTYNGGSPDKGPGRYVKPVVIALVVAAIAALIWHFASDTAGVKRASAPQVTTVIPLPPPPPPPKQKPPPEKVKEEVKTPVDKPTVAPKPSEAPKPSDNQPKQMTMNAPAQAGTDSFNIGAGDGSGMVGSGGGGRFGNASYAQYMVYVLQRAIEQDKGVQDAGGARFAGSLNLWMDPSGRITKVTIAQSTGDAKIDAAVVAAVESLGRVDEAPPPATAYPVLVRLQGRKPA
ncbi:energy transducer TonB [Burkholderia pseudomultivorans]|uniref:energy transducer TonB family protein n=1 Tax=Burkholderia pseudomultivorans TaxID=1207504 RepID=UPI0001FDA71E|nr:energy transducer TonB [Burkholderia pseudomultivorans]EGD06705.1 TonB-like protein [Burkholderia sp. TJI49]AOI90402.1 energy transducer TonB [Burkholderia pseudomultivorans]KVC18103.1 energy transducer TonB [Burkholderia pseudomultivorans]KVC32978.1 energy transducer TonB [Burkholderia pseudomultivorans]KVC57240.1 energy transducer TonB [Burkholderia pseudomultivorans]